MSSYVLSAAADFDLEEIWEYIAADNLDAADRWIDNCSTHLKPWGEGTEGRVHFIRYTPEMEQARAQGWLRTNFFPAFAAPVCGWFSFS